MVPNNERIKTDVPGNLLVCLLVRSCHIFACSALLALLTRSAVLIRSLACSLTPKLVSKCCPEHHAVLNHSATECEKTSFVFTAQILFSFLNNVTGAPSSAAREREKQKAAADST